jgi:hypothetical protein
LVNNAIAIDSHDHTPGKGAPLSLDSFPTIDQTKMGVCSVNTPQICPAAVTDTRLASPAVRSQHIYSDAVNQSHIASGAVGSSELADGSVTEPKLADSAASVRVIADGAVTNPKLNNGAVSSTKLATAAVVTDKISDLNVTTTKYANASITSAKIADSAVEWSNMHNNSVGLAELRRVPACYLTINNRQSVGHNDFKQVVWDTNRYDTDDMWDRDDTRKYIRVRTPGLYLVEACVMWEDGPAHGGVSGRRAKIRRNNTAVSGAGPLTSLQDSPGPAAPYRVRLPMLAVIGCAQGDKFDVVVEQTTGGSQDIVPEGLVTHFSVSWIAPFPGTGNDFIPDTEDGD